MATLVESYKYPSTFEREPSNPGAREQPPPRNDRLLSRARAKLQDRELGVFVFYPSLTGCL